MKILTVDYNSPNAAACFVESIRSSGFALVENHPIDHSLIDTTFSKWEVFFALPEEEKRQYLFKRNFDRVQSGFFPQEISETAKGFSVKDMKEFFHYYPSGELLPKIVGESTKKIRLELISMAKTLLSWLEAALPETIVEQLSMQPSEMVDEQYQTLLRVLHYPPLKGMVEENSVRAAAHEDINLITLLVSPSASGLQALNKEGVWQSVPCKKNTIIVNIGDMLQECTQGYYRATKHRVVNPSGDIKNTSRYSMPLFLHPREQVRLSERYTAKQYLGERIRELGLS
jgi:isopenicillin N synthase-like dioxygenase